MREGCRPGDTNFLDAFHFGYEVEVGEWWARLAGVEDARTGLSRLMAEKETEAR